MSRPSTQDVIELLRDISQNKPNLIRWLKENLSLIVPVSSSYEKIVETVVKSGKEEDFCQKEFGTTDFDTAVEKYDIAKAIETFSKEDLITIADTLSHNGKRWKYDKRNLTSTREAIINNTNKEEFARYLQRLISDGKIPPLNQYEKWVVGPLGITRSVARKKGTNAEDIIKLLSKYITYESYDEFRKRASFLPDKLNLDDGDTLLLTKFYQLVLSHGKDEQMLNVFNQLIEEGIIKVSNEEQYWSLTITPCGVFADIEYEPVEKLVDILIEELSEKTLRKELQAEGYETGSVKLRTFEKCMKDPPEQILDKMFGLPQLRKIGKSIGLVAVERVGNKHELIRYILIRIGFSVPRTLEGIVQYTRVLDGYLRQIDLGVSSEQLRGIMTSVFVETEKILKDLIYFYTSCLWKEIEDQFDPEEMFQEANRLIRDKFGAQKEVTSLSFGQLVNLLKHMNQSVAEYKELKSIIKKNFGRDSIIPTEEITLLERLAANRARFTHDTETKVTQTVYAPSEIVKLLITIANKFHSRKIYPILLRILREVTNEYGVTHLEALDEEGRQWVIKSDEWTPTERVYMMQTQTDRVAIHPLMITRFW